MLLQKLPRIPYCCLSFYNFYFSSISSSTKMSSSSISTLSNSLSADPDLPIEKAKKSAAFACGEAYIRSGQKIGVGSGSTVKYLVEFLKEKYHQRYLEDIICVPTSFMTRKWLLDAGLPVTTLEEEYELDIAIDGADEVDEHLNLIKGGGGCLTQEKIVQHASKTFIVIADANKKSRNLGDHYKVIPIEVLPFAYKPVQNWIMKNLGGSTSLRISSTKCMPLITDNNNYIIEWNFPKIDGRNWKETNSKLLNIPGIVETGLFLDVADSVYFAQENGKIEIIKKTK